MRPPKSYKVIHPSDLPTKFPLSITLVIILWFDRFPQVELIEHAVYFVLCLAWIGCFVNFVQTTWKHVPGFGEEP